jgi:predicted NBD/HSP70 family sugar kinase
MATTDEVDLTETERAVLSVILQSGETTRPEVGRVLGFSKPTVSAAVVRLESAGLVAAVRAHQGSLGRAATVYAVAPAAGWLLGVDIGVTRVRLLARGLDGREIRSFSRNLEGTVRYHGDVLDVVRAEAAIYVRELPAAHGPLRSVGVALPRVIPEYVAALPDSPPVADHTLDEILGALDLPPGVPVLLENNVNCAALAEMDRGTAQTYDDFVFLQVGVGIGSGIIADRRMIRGARGGAGEVAFIPVGWPASAGRVGNELEEYLGSGQLLVRCQNAWSDAEVAAPTSVPELFDLAGRGIEDALRFVNQHALDISQLALTLAALVDPALIVLGGGVGQNPLLTEAVEREVQRHKPNIEVRVSALGDLATVEGAVALTFDRALSTLLGGRHLGRIDGRTQVVISS